MKKTFTLFIALLVIGFTHAQTTHNVTVQSNSFTPNNLTIEIGDEVVWTNIGGSHNVNGTLATYPSNPEGFGNSVGSGWTFSHTFTLPGTYDYRCDPHFSFGMFGVITVNTPPQVDTCDVYLWGPWTDFNILFGGAPVASAPGECPFNEITDLQVWASESFTVDGFVNGENYTFSMCGGDFGAWVPQITVWDADGNVVALVEDDCSISWSATYDGTYVIGINEVGACGAASTNTNTDNGFPALTCEGLIFEEGDCDTFIGGPWGDFNTIFGGAPVAVDGVCPLNEIDAFQVWASEAYTVDGFVNGETYTFSMCNGYGAWAAELSIWDENGDMISMLSDTCSISWTATYDGTYVIGINEVGACGPASDNTATDNGFPALTCEGASGIEDLSITNFNVYPNPNNGQFSIVNEGVNGNYIIELIDVTGKVVYSEQVQMNSNDRTEINSSNVNTGVYLIKMTNTDENYQRTLRMIIK